MIDIKAKIAVTVMMLVVGVLIAIAPGTTSADADTRWSKYDHPPTRWIAWCFSSLSIGSPFIRAIFFRRTGHWRTGVKPVLIGLCFLVLIRIWLFA